MKEKVIEGSLIEKMSTPDRMCKWINMECSLKKKRFVLLQLSPAQISLADRKG